MFLFNNLGTIHLEIFLWWCVQKIFFDVFCVWSEQGKQEDETTFKWKLILLLSLLFFYIFFFPYVSLFFSSGIAFHQLLISLSFWVLLQIISCSLVLVVSQWTK